MSIERKQSFLNDVADTLPCMDKRPTHERTTWILGALGRYGLTLVHVEPTDEQLADMAKARAAERECYYMIGSNLTAGSMMVRRAADNEFMFDGPKDAARAWIEQQAARAAWRAVVGGGA